MEAVVTPAAAARARAGITRTSSRPIEKFCGLGMANELRFIMIIPCAAPAARRTAS